ncbi:uncharacterized protein LOC117322844 [Pecten maximus]|uniref:uncharacterized protein LOC117322844 n=1 Tax=Pecten maximus TaxID=6579 RepID=UPI001458767B|nr:uncharacterized protein LOC117322844 [Pecten maximus]
MRTCLKNRRHTTRSGRSHVTQRKSFKGTNIPEKAIRKVCLTTKNEKGNKIGDKFCLNDLQTDPMRYEGRKEEDGSETAGYTQRYVFASQLNTLLKHRYSSFNNPLNKHQESRPFLQNSEGNQTHPTKSYTGGKSSTRTNIGTSIDNSLNEQRTKTNITTDLKTGFIGRSHLHSPYRKMIIANKLQNQRENSRSQREEEKTNPDGSQLQPIPSPCVEIYTWNQYSPIMTLSKQTEVENTIRNISNMLQEDKASSLTLFHGDKELQRSEDFEHALGSTSYPVRLDVVIQPAERIPEESLMKFNLHDMIDGDLSDDSAVMVQMSCGHATSKSDLNWYIL